MLGQCQPRRARWVGTRRSGSVTRVKVWSVGRTSNNSSALGSGASVRRRRHLVHGVEQGLVEDVDVLALGERRDCVVEALLELREGFRRGLLVRNRRAPGSR